jgi:hypothetical protein
MNDKQTILQHFILTRFNLLLWNKDKGGGKVRTRQWLEHRFALFEKYCLPSIISQTCQDFEWIVLFDSRTPDDFQLKIESYQKVCPQMIPIFVEPQNGRYFAEVFRREIVKRLAAERVLTTYLDNDDSLNIGFVRDLQSRARSLNDGTFIYYSDGYQFYTDQKYLMKIHFPKNHFVSVVEKGDPSVLKGVFGYGGHGQIDDIKGVAIERIDNQLMWCEVVHEKNMVNDAYYVNAKMVKDADRLRNDFAIDEAVEYGTGLYLFSFLPRYIKTFFARVKHRLFGWEW